MKVASKNDLLISKDNAVALEQEGDFAKALQVYDKLLKINKSDLNILSRLMILSRKLKKYKQEIQYIDKAIGIHEKKYTAQKPKGSKVVSISKQLNTLLGHTDKKGKSLLAIPEVERLKKRRATVEKKI